MDVLHTLDGRRGPLMILMSGLLLVLLGTLLLSPETPAARGADATVQASPTPTATPSPTTADVMTLVQVLQGQSTTVNIPPSSVGEPRPTPRLTVITKTDQRDTIAAGEFLAYRITVRNDGDEPATNVRVVDRVPSSLLPDLPSITPAGTADANTRTITWSETTISAHADKTFSFRAQVHPAVPPGFVVHNVADVAAPGFLGSAADRTTVVGATPAAPPAPKGTITISAPRPVPLEVKTGMDASTVLLSACALLTGAGAHIARRHSR
ncbi:MAG: hypothetical protein Q8R32_02390 [bacterium]|nr:hypothetical protein [bacterium]